MLAWHYGPMWTDDGAWICYCCIILDGSGTPGLTDCEWLVPGTTNP
jgi:hypothetical protein